MESKAAEIQLQIQGIEKKIKKQEETIALLEKNIADALTFEDSENLSIRKRQAAFSLSQLQKEHKVTQLEHKQAVYQEALEAYQAKMNEYNAGIVSVKELDKEVIKAVDDLQDAFMKQNALVTQLHHDREQLADTAEKLGQLEPPKVPYPNTAQLNEHLFNVLKHHDRRDYIARLLMLNHMPIYRGPWIESGKMPD